MGSRCLIRSIRRTVYKSRCISICGQSHAPLSRFCVSVLNLESFLVAAVFANASQTMLLLVKDPLRAIFGRSFNAEYIDVNPTRNWNQEGGGYKPIINSAPGHLPHFFTCSLTNQFNSRQQPLRTSPSPEGSKQLHPRSPSLN